MACGATCASNNECTGGRNPCGTIGNSSQFSYSADMISGRPGCGRTLPEIARWHRMERAERLAVMDGLPARMAEAGLAQIAEPPASG